MVIKTKLTKADFINANLALLYKKTSTKVYVALGIITFFYLDIYAAIFLGMDWSFIYIIPPFVFLFLSPIATWLVANKNYSSSQRITETIEYQFDKDYLLVKGDSFTSQSTWEKIYKVTETKKFILIWQSRAVANIIPKRDIWEGDIIELKEILDSHGVKNTLKTN